MTKEGVKTNIEEGAVDVVRGGAKWLTFEYALAMGSLVMAVILTSSALVSLFGGWAGNGSAISHTGASWVLGLFSLNMVTPATGLTATVVAAVMLAGLALLCFGRVSRSITERKGYTKRLAYKGITYGTFAALFVLALALAARLGAILISSLLFIGVDGAGGVYKSLYVAEFLPYALSLGLVVVTMMFVSKIIGGVNRSRIASLVVLGASLAVMVASVITLAVQVHDKDTSSDERTSREYIRDLRSVWDLD